VSGQQSIDRRVLRISHSVNIAAAREGKCHTIQTIVDDAASDRKPRLPGDRIALLSGRRGHARVVLMSIIPEALGGREDAVRSNGGDRRHGRLHRA